LGWFASIVLPTTNRREIQIGCPSWAEGMSYHWLRLWWFRPLPPFPQRWRGHRRRLPETVPHNRTSGPFKHTPIIALPSRWADRAATASPTQPPFSAGDSHRRWIDAALAEKEDENDLDLGHHYCASCSKKGEHSVQMVLERDLILRAVKFVFYAALDCRMQKSGATFRI
jgi:hypothetical protein